MPGTSSASPCGSLSNDACARQVLSAFLPRALRRNVASADIERYVTAVTKQVAQGDSIVESIRMAIGAAIKSPSFLFIDETESGVAAGTTNTAERTLNGYEVANRLSYFFWKSMPDQTLFDRAKDGTLVSNTATLTAQADRLMADTKFDRFLDSFATQWLMSKLDSTTFLASVFSGWNDGVRADMRTETTMMLKYIIRNSQPVDQLVTGNYSFLNQNLATLYGIGGVSGSAFVKKDGLPNNRAGLLTQGSYLAQGAKPDHPSAVLRGKWVLDQLLCTPPPPPPNNVDTSAFNNPGSDTSRLPARQQLEIHLKSPDCKSCHRQMDAIGLAFENFSPLGKFSTTDMKGNTVDTSGDLFDKPFAGYAELPQIITSSPDYRACITTKLRIAGLGRSTDYKDLAARCESKAAVGRAASAGQDTIPGLIRQIVLGNGFRKAIIRN
jgi:hypothetical protein